MARAARLPWVKLANALGVQDVDAAESRWTLEVTNLAALTGPAPILLL